MVEWMLQGKEAKMWDHTLPLTSQNSPPTYSFHRYLWSTSHVPQAPLLGGGDAEIKGD